MAETVPFHEQLHRRRLPVRVLLPPLRQRSPLRLPARGHQLRRADRRAGRQPAASSGRGSSRSACSRSTAAAAPVASRTTSGCGRRPKTSPNSSTSAAGVRSGCAGRSAGTSRRGSVTSARPSVCPPPPQRWGARTAVPWGPAGSAVTAAHPWPGRWPAGAVVPTPRAPGSAGSAAPRPADHPPRGWSRARRLSPMAARAPARRRRNRRRRRARPGTPSTCRRTPARPGSA